MYVASDYGSLIDHIYEVSDANDLDMIGFFYDTKRRKGRLKIPEYAEYFFKDNKLARGPFLYLSRLKSVAKKCIKTVEKYKPDILHGHMMFCDGIICNMVYKRLGIEYVVSVRNTDMNLWFLWRLPWIRKKGIEVALNAKGIIFINNPYTNLFLERMPLRYRKALREKMTVVPNGVDRFWHENRYKPHVITAGKPIKLLTVGRIERNKNQETVAEALKILKDYGTEAVYTNVGAVKDEGIAKRLKKIKNISLVNDLPKERLIDFYREADIFVLTSLRETFGLVYMEAMTQGLPVIYSEGQGVDGLFNDGEIGYRVKKDDPDEIANRVIKIIENYSDISKRCLEHSLGFTWDKTVKKFAEVYR